MAIQSSARRLLVIAPHHLKLTPPDVSMAVLSRWGPRLNNTSLSLPITPLHYPFPPPPQARRWASTSAVNPPTPLPPSPATLPDPSRRPRPLPSIPSHTPKLILASVAAILSWTAFTLYAMNAERASSSPFKSVLSQVKGNHRVHHLLGETDAPIKGETKWYSGGHVWVGGTISLGQGRIDIRFGIKGAKDTATVYFTSLRPSQSQSFEDLRFLVVNDRTGEKISLLE